MSGLEYGVVAFRKSDNRIVRYQYTDVRRNTSQRASQTDNTQQQEQKKGANQYVPDQTPDEVPAIQPLLGADGSVAAQGKGADREKKYIRQESGTLLPTLGITFEY